MSPEKRRKIYEYALNIANSIIFLFLSITIILFLIYMAYAIYGLYVGIIQEPTMDVLHDVVFIIVLVKAYRLLISYLEAKHVSIKYIVEISIIAPLIEVIFAWHERSVIENGLMALISISFLIVYMIYYKKFDLMKIN